MTESADITIESLQALLGEKDATIAKLKSRATTYVEQLKADHAELLLKETTARQNLQDKLDAAKPVFIRLKEEKTALSDSLSKLTDEHDAADKLLKTKLLEIEKNEKDFEAQQAELLTLRNASKSSASLMEDKIKELKKESDAAQARAEGEHEDALEKLSASLLNQKGSQEKQNQDNVDLLAASAQSTATIKQLRDEVVALSSNKDDLSTKLESCSKELTDFKKQQKDVEALHKSQVALTAEKATALIKEIEDLKVKLVVSDEKQKKSTEELVESSEKHSVLEKKLVENESKMKSSEGVSEKVASLTRDLQLSEERLKEAEEIAWKSKAEASEIVYAMEQEQASVKKLSAEVEVMKAKAEQDSLKHAETLKSRDLEVEALKKKADAAAETAKSIAPLSVTAATPADTKAKEGKSPEPLVATTPVQKKDADSTVTEDHSTEVKKDQTAVEQSQSATLDSKVHLERISLLESELAEAKKRALDAPDLTNKLKKSESSAEELNKKLSEVKEELLALKAAKVEGLKDSKKEEGVSSARIKELENALAAAKKDKEDVTASLKTTHAKMAEESSHALTSASSKASEHTASLEAELTALKAKGVADQTAAAEKLADVAGQIATVQEQLRVSKGELKASKESRDADVNAITKQLTELKGQLDAVSKKSKEHENKIEEKKSSEQNSLIAAAAQHASALSDMAATHHKAIAAQEESQKHLKEKMESTKVMVTQLKDSIAVLTKKETDLTETVSRLTARCEEQDKVSADKAKELDVIKQKHVQTASQLEDLQKRYAEQEKKMIESASAPDKSIAAMALLTTAADDAKKETALLRTQHSEELASLQLKITESETTIVEQKKQLSELTAHQQSAAAQTGDMEAKHTELEATIKSLQKNLQDAKTEIEASTAKVASLSKAQADAKEASSKKTTSLSSDVQRIETAFAVQKTDLEASKANLAATTTAYSALSAQHNQVKAKVDQLTQQLEAELQQTQERKLKVRAYVDNINTEKRDIESSKQAMADQLEGARTMIASLEAAVTAEEAKLKKEEMRFNAARQSALLDMEQQQQDFMQRMAAQEEVLALQKMETASLQGQLDEHAKATTEEVQEAYRQMALSGKELESHKAKRLVARNEMIGAAQALERSQSEGMALRAYIQYKLAPIVFEQVAALEMLLSAVEHFRSQMSSKGNVRLHTTASGFLSRRNSNQIQSPPSPDTSTNSNTALTLRNGATKAGEESDLKGLFLADGNRSKDTGIQRSGSSPVPGSNRSSSSPYSNGQTAQSSTVSVLGEAMEQAEVLRKELNRVHAGLSLLSHSVDRLGDIVEVDSRCCGGVFQMLSDSMTGSIEGTLRGSIEGRTMVSHNNTGGGSRGHSRLAPSISQGIGSMISSSLGYSTVSGDDRGSAYSGNQKRSTSPPRDLGSLSQHNKDGTSNGGKGGIDMSFSILSNDDDDDGEEIEII